MIKIQLTQGKIALIDDEDYDKVSIYKFYAFKNNKGNWYAKTSCIDISRKSLAAIILNISNDKVIIKFKNKNSLDCRKENLVVIPTKLGIRKIFSRQLVKQLLVKLILDKEIHTIIPRAENLADEYIASLTPSNEPLKKEQ